MLGLCRFVGCQTVQTGTRQYQWDTLLHVLAHDHCVERGGLRLVDPRPFGSCPTLGAPLQRGRVSAGCIELDRVQIGDMTHTRTSDQRMRTLQTDNSNERYPTRRWPGRCHAWLYGGCSTLAGASCAIAVQCSPYGR